MFEPNGNLLLPIHFARSLVGRERTNVGNRRLGYTLTFIAGATNAGGFLAIAQYTSHMTGIVSAMADQVVLGQYTLMLAGAAALLMFVTGAGCSAVMVNFARRHQMHSEYALPLLLEALLLLVFGTLGSQLASIHSLFTSVTVMLLCFIMGLQNAAITKLSHAEIRTTHITGMVTDLGIELGKLVYWNAGLAPQMPKVFADRVRLRILGLMVATFFVGGVVGALGFKFLGFTSTLPLAMALVLLAAVPAADDVAQVVRRQRLQRHINRQAPQPKQ